ncbi:NAD(P)-binding protein [Rhizodiscina lignyota]|uniref:Short-chain dehydrogenase/reductase 3 n=1 Tax=Rhizodiscina lignyota TaxID=1504668 RepID=A0A9P4IQE7_9PEZI|nr:NAD(P)-binding protein [Rhizodiscina lignyota]
MPLRSEWSLPREGFVFDTIIRFLKRTAFNPALTLPLLLLARYTSKGRDIAAARPKALKWLKTLLALGLYNEALNFMSRGAVNNWTNDTYDWSKEIVLVTGGSDGIGASVVKMLAERGIKVVVLDVQPLKYAAPPQVYYFECDLSNPAQIKSVAADVISFVGHPTIIINNAGFARGKAFMDISQDDLRLTFQINTLSHYHLLQQFLPEIVKRNHGMVVTVASSAAYVTAPRITDYCASKAAALATHEGLQAELATIYKAPKVRCVAVCQGYTKTALFEGFDQGDGFLNYALEQDTVAEAIVRAILKGRSDTIILPHVNWWIVAPLRGTSLWWQTGLRKRTVKLMEKFHGRQVEQPSETKEDGEKVESSGVLV